MAGPSAIHAILQQMRQYQDEMHRLEGSGLKGCGDSPGDHPQEVFGRAVQAICMDEHVAAVVIVLQAYGQEVDVIGCEAELLVCPGDRIALIQQEDGQVVPRWHPAQGLCLSCKHTAKTKCTMVSYTKTWIVWEQVF